MAADRELDFIKLKVDWYKSVFPWILAMVVGAVTFANSIKGEHLILRFVFALLLLSIILLLFTLLSCWYASLALIHRLEEPLKTKSKLFNWFFSAPVGIRWETYYAILANVSLVTGLVIFVSALIIYGYANTVIKPIPKSDTTSAAQQQK
jgi:tellurite resistance protein TehA-like permease